MDKKDLIIIISIVAAIFIVALFIKNWKDRKKVMPPKGSNPVQEEHMRRDRRKDRL